MRKRSHPSPSLVVACLALAIALGGTAYAASLPRNSVGSPQVKPNSLTGADINEAKLAGLMSGNARSTAKVLPANTAPTTLLTFPGIGRLSVACGSGGTTEFTYRNTSKVKHLLWWDNGSSKSLNGVFAGNSSSGALGSFSNVDIIVETPKRTVLIKLMTVLNPGVSCTHIAASVNIAKSGRRNL